MSIPRPRPPAVRAFLMSLLAVRKVALGEEFREKFFHPWLVWEPGSWRFAARTAPTQLAKQAAAPDRPAQGDALCFELGAKRALKIGRAVECDVVINDATVSREHLVLEPHADGWRVRPVAGAKAGATVDGHPIDPLGSAVTPGTKLRLGEVALTFHDAASFERRLVETMRTR